MAGPGRLGRPRSRPAAQHQGAGRRRPLRCFLLALSASYLDACRDDITGGQPWWPTRTPSWWSPPEPGFPGAARRVMVPADARLQVLPGRHPAGAQHPDRRPPAVGRDQQPRRRIPVPGATDHEQPPIRRYERKKLTDQEVRDMIADGWRGARGVSEQAAARVPGCRVRVRAAAVRAPAPPRHGERDMTIRTAAPVLARRALRITQAADAPLYMFSLTAGEILQVADISRVSRDDLGELIGYQRPEVRQHIQEITDYLDSDQLLFPNPIIIALPSTVRFTCSRGPNVSDGIAASGTLEIPLADEGARKPGWIVDGQQRAFALARAKRQDFPVPVNAFVADSVDLQRDQFLRINNTRPLPRGLVTELLPKISTSLPPRLSVRQIPSALCDLLNSNEDSPFRGLIRRPSTSAEERATAVVTDTSIVQACRKA